MTQFVDFVALGWVEKSLREEVEAARHCLHLYQREPDQASHLQDAERNIHAASGVLRLCALEPAVLLTEEIERVLHQLHSDVITGDERKLAMTELVAAIEAIPAYMARVRTNREVSVSSVATAVNELRQFSKLPQLPESLYFDPTLPDGAGVSANGIFTDDQALRDFGQRAAEVCLKHSQGAIDGETDALEQMSSIASEAQALLCGSPMEPYFACFGGTLEALAKGEAVADEAIIAVFLNCFGFFSSMAHKGAATLDKARPAPYLKKMLYYIGRSADRSEAQQALLDSFAIADVDEHIVSSSGRMIQEDDLLDALKQPLQQLLEIMQFLTSKEEAICNSNTELTDSIVPGLHQVAIQLGVLGLEEQADIVAEQHGILQQYAAKEEPTTPAEMVDFGAALITVQEVLEFKLRHGFSATGNGAVQDLDNAIAEQVLRCLGDMKESINREFVRQGLLAFSEAKPNKLDISIAGLRPLFRAARMAGDKDLLSAMENWDEDGYPDSETLQAIASDLLQQFQDTGLAERAVEDISQVLAVFDLLENKQREWEVLRKCAEFVRESVELGGLVNDASMACFAETIAALEQFMEGRSEDPRDESDEHLARAEERVAELEAFLSKRVERSQRSDNIVDFTGETRVTGLSGQTRGKIVNFATGGANSSELGELSLTLATPQMDATVTGPLDIAAADDTQGSQATETSSAGGVAHWREAMKAWAANEIERAPEASDDSPEASFDDELRECFVEECQEYIDRLQESAARFAADPTSADIIGEIRTSFHTMKGSARTIDLNEFGEFMHDMEAVFNALRDGYIEGSAKLAEFVSVVARCLPGYMDLISAKIPLLTEDFEIPHTIAAAAADKKFSEDFELELVGLSTATATATASDAVKEASEPVTEQDVAEKVGTVPYSGTIWGQLGAAAIVDSVLHALHAAESTVSAVMDLAEQLVGALVPPLVEMRDAQLLELDGQLFGYFADMARLQHLASGAFYGVVESDGNDQQRLSVSEEAIDGLGAYLEEVGRYGDNSSAHDDAVSLVHSALNLVREEPAEVGEEPIAESSNVVAFPDQAAAQDQASDIDEELLDLFIETLDEYTESIDSAVSSLASGESAALRDLKNTLHTVKGAANSVGLRELGRFVHEFESSIGELEFAGDVDSHEALSTIDTLVSEFADATRYVRSNKVDWNDAARRQLAAPKDESQEAAAEAAIAEEARTDNLRIKTHKIDRLLDLGLEISMSNVRCRQALDSASQERTEVQSLARRVLALVDKLSLQLDTEIQAKTESMSEGEQFDPLEMDRITEKQSLAAILREAAYDLQEEATELGHQLSAASREAQSSTRLLQTNQSELRMMRLVNFSKLGPGLRRLVHQVSRQLGKQVEFDFICGEGGLDIGAFEQIRVALEHMLRNAIDHGIGTPEQRVAQGKAETGNIKLNIARQGSEFVIRLLDDGSGMDPDALRTKAGEMGLVDRPEDLSDAEAMRLVFNAGFTTADSVTDVSGRGVGMDVVYQSITQAGGNVNVQSKAGFYTQFDIRVPASIMVNGALLATVQEEQIAVPLTSLKGSEFYRRDEVFQAASDKEGRLNFRGEEYEVRYLGTMRNNLPAPQLDMMPDFVPVLFAQHGRRRVAFYADGLDSAEDMVIRSLGAQYTGVPGVAGGAVKPDGKPVLALDLNEFVSQVDHADQVAASTDAVVDDSIVVLCVDDSVMMRRTYEKRLGSLGYKVITAVDGEDALDYLSETARLPDFIFTDLEMPNMNGFEFIANMRRVPKMKQIPTVVVSSRDAEKHRAEAQRAGATGFMAKGSNSTEGMQAVIEQHLTAKALAS